MEIYQIPSEESGWTGSQRRQLTKLFGYQLVRVDKEKDPEWIVAAILDSIKGRAANAVEVMATTLELYQYSIDSVLGTPVIPLPNAIYISTKLWDHYNSSSDAADWVLGDW
jgi:hypothetical protein